MRKIVIRILPLLFCTMCVLCPHAQVTSLDTGTNFTVDTSTTISIDGNFITAGTVANSGTLNVSGDWANTGTSNVGGMVNLSGTVLNISGQTNFSNTNLDGTSAQQITDSNAAANPSDMGNLTVSNSNGVSLGSNLYASQTLTLGSNLLTTNSYSMQLGANAATSNTTGYVLGNLQKAFDTGTQNFNFIVGTANGYSPATVAFNNVSNAGSLTVNATQTYEPHAPVPAEVLNRYWTLAADGGLAYDYFNINLNYLSIDFNGDPFVQSTMEAHMRGAAYNPTWNYPTVGTRVADNGPTGSIQLLNLTAAGDFTAAEPSITGDISLSDMNRISIWSYENRVFVDFTKLSNVNAEVQLYNVLGQILSDEYAGKVCLYSREIMNLDAAYIVVKVMNENEMITRKVFVSAANK